MALDSWDNICFALPYLSQASMVFSRPQLAYWYYLEISPTALQNCRINKSLKKHHRYIYWLPDWLGKIQSPCGPFSPQTQQQSWSFTCKNIQPKNKKENQILPTSIEKIKFLLSKKTVDGSFRSGITMGECKTKAIQTNLGTLTHSLIIRHIQELFRHIQAYLEPCVTLTYLKLSCIQNPNIFRTSSIFRTLAYSKSCRASTMKG